MRQRPALILAVSLGLAALAVALVIGFHAQQSAFRAAAHRQREVFHSEVLLVACAASMMPDLTDDERLKRIGEAWSADKLSMKEYLSIYDSQDTLLFHSARPFDPGGIVSSGISLPSSEFLARTRASESGIVGGFLDATEKPCIAAAITATPPGWTFAVYFPREEIRTVFWERILIVRWLYVLLCAGLMPGSLLLMYTTVRHSMRSALHSATALQEAQGTLRSLMNASNDAAMLLDRRGTILALNDSAAALCNSPPAALLGGDSYTLVPGVIAAERRAQMEHVFRTGESVREEVLYEGRILHLSMNPVYDLSGTVDRIAVFGRDITERRNAEIALRRSEERFRKLAAHAPVGIFLASTSGDCQYANDRWRQMVDMKNSDIRSICWAHRVHPEDQDRVFRAWNDAVRTGEEFSEECRFVAEDGTIRWLACSAIALRDDLGNISGYLGTATDITGRRSAEENLRASLQEKEVLLREIHHRVKNNLQIMSSLLELQSARVADPEVQALFADSRRRMRAMALLHEKLCGLNHRDRIDAREYLSALVETVFSSFGARAADLVPIIEIGECELDVDTAIPCGIIVNELVSNALEHAFGGLPGGRIWIRLIQAEEGYTLTVADDGHGLPQELDVENPSSLGLQLVRMLTLQLRGEMLCRGEGGAEVSIRFPKR